MTANHPRLRQTRETALDAFTARKAEIDEILARIQGLSDDHFNVLADDVHWGHVGDLVHYANQLRLLADSAFEGYLGPTMAEDLNRRILVGGRSGFSGIVRKE